MLVFQNNFGSNYLVRNLIKDAFSAVCVILHTLIEWRKTSCDSVSTHRVGEDGIQWTVPKNVVRSGGNRLKLGAVVSKWESWQCEESLAHCCVLSFAAYLFDLIGQMLRSKVQHHQRTVCYDSFSPVLISYLEPQIHCRRRTILMDGWLVCL